MIQINDIQHEVDENFEEFQKLMQTLVGQHRDQLALMKGRVRAGRLPRAA